MLAVMRDPAQAPARRLRADASAAPYVHAKAGATGKKDAAEGAAKVATTGRFKWAAPPIQLVPR